VIFRTQDSDIDIATGDDLDTIGKRHGVIRKHPPQAQIYGGYHPETDAEFRDRIKASMPKKLELDVSDFSGGWGEEPKKLPPDPEEERRKREKEFFFPHKNNNGCTCGSWIAGYVGFGPFHNRDMCQLYRKD